jgi:hypothetical protein
MQYLVEVKGSLTLGGTTFDEETLSEMSPFHRRHVEAESPDEAARLVVEGAGLLRSAINEVWVELGDSWMVYGRDGKQVRQQSKERN